MVCMCMVLRSEVLLRRQHASIHMQVSRTRKEIAQLIGAVCYPEEQCQLAFHGARHSRVLLVCARPLAGVLIAATLCPADVC